MTARLWRKSSYSGNQGDCVELGYPTDSRTNGPDAVRDSKNAAGPALPVAGLHTFVSAVKSGRFDR